MMRSKELDNYETLLPKMHPLVMDAMRDRLYRRMVNGGERPVRNLDTFTEGMTTMEAVLTDPFYTDEECAQLARDTIIWMFRQQTKEAVTVISFADAMIEADRKRHGIPDSRELADVNALMAKEHKKLRRTFGRV